MATLNGSRSDGRARRKVIQIKSGNHLANTPAGQNPEKKKQTFFSKAAQGARPDYQNACGTCTNGPRLGKRVRRGSGTCRQALYRTRRAEVAQSEQASGIRFEYAAGPRQKKNAKIKLRPLARRVSTLLPDYPTRRLVACLFC